MREHVEEQAVKAKSDAAEVYRMFLHHSPLPTLEEINRFIAWYEEEGQIHSSWDDRRYSEARMALSYAALQARNADLEAEVKTLTATAARYGDATLVDEAWLRSTLGVPTGEMWWWRVPGMIVEWRPSWRSDPGCYVRDANWRIVISLPTRRQLSRLLDALRGAV